MKAYILCFLMLKYNHQLQFLISLTGLVTPGGNPSYVASKHAVTAFTQSLAVSRIMNIKLAKIKSENSRLIVCVIFSKWEVTLK